MSMRTAVMSGRCAAALALALSACAAQRAEAGAMYGVTDLGDLQVTSISNAGEVVGQGGNFSGSVIYRDGLTTPITEPGYSSVSNAVISPGGTLAYSVVYPALAAHVQKDGQAYSVGSADDGFLVGGGPYSVAHAVNDSGTVAGESHAYARWNRAFMSYQGPDGKYNPIAMGANGGATSAATAINSKGQVVGWSDVAGQWRNHAWIDSPRNDIGTLGGLNSKATGINDKGQVVGWSTLATDYKPPAQPSSYYDPGASHAFVYQDGKMSDLGTLPGFRNSTAEAINAGGLIVGQSSNPSTYDPVLGNIAAVAHAALFDANSGSAADLNDLIAPGAGWVLNDARDINDSGQIIGSGTLDGVAHSFLLTPLSGDLATVPEPSALYAFAGLAVAFAARMRASRRSRRTNRTTAELR